MSDYSNWLSMKQHGPRRESYLRPGITITFLAKPPC
jgi:hypothetical protein